MNYLYLSAYLNGHYHAPQATKLNQSVVVRIGDEYYPVTDICEVGEEQDVLDSGHLVLIVE